MKERKEWTKGWAWKGKWPAGEGDGWMQDREISSTLITEGFFCCSWGMNAFLGQRETQLGVEEGGGGSENRTFQSVCSNLSCSGSKERSRGL